MPAKHHQIMLYVTNSSQTGFQTKADNWLFELHILHTVRYVYVMNPYLIPQCSHKSFCIAWVTHRLLDDMPPKKNSYLQTKNMTGYKFIL